MKRLLVSARKSFVRSTKSQPIVSVSPESADWEYVGFDVYRLQQGDTIALSTGGRETAVIVLEGTCDIQVGAERFAGVGGRQSVFEQRPPEVVLTPPGPDVGVVALERCEVAVATAVTDEVVGVPRVIRAADIPYEERGARSTTRHIYHLLDEHSPASKLLLVEVVTPEGNWSSYPPHKHSEEIPGKEAYLEETYYYRINPGHGHAVQRIYDKGEMNELLLPSDGDVVLVPKGYHPVASLPGFTSYYLNVMAGHHRTWRYTLDEDYAHIAPKDGNIMGIVKRDPQG